MSLDVQARETELEPNLLDTEPALARCDGRHRETPVDWHVR